MEICYMANLNKKNYGLAVCDHCNDLFLSDAEEYKSNLSAPLTKAAIAGFGSVAILLSLFIIGIFSSLSPQFFTVPALLLIVVASLCFYYHFQKCEEWYEKQYLTRYYSLLDEHVQKKGLGEEDGIFYSYDGETKLYKAVIINDSDGSHATEHGYGTGYNKDEALIDLYQLNRKKETEINIKNALETACANKDININDEKDENDSNKSDGFAEFLKNVREDDSTDYFDVDDDDDYDDENDSSSNIRVANNSSDDDDDVQDEHDEDDDIDERNRQSDVETIVVNFPKY